MAIIKAVVLGDTECGKTSFTTRWTQGTFPDPSMLKTTVGASFDTLKTTLPSGRDVTLSVWDFGGQRRFIEALKGMIRGAKVGLFFFDASHLPTLDNLYNYWIPTAQEYGNFDFNGSDRDKFILVANKIDLISSDFTALETEMERFCTKFGMQCAMISAKTGVGIEQLDYKFKEIVDSVLE